MLALRLARGARPAVQARRLAVAAASAGTGFLLLSSLGQAAALPAGAGSSAVRLLWCALPLAASVQLAVAAARADHGAGPRQNLYAAGFGPARLALLAAASTVLSCLLGGVAAALVFLLLRGDLGIPSVPGAEQALGAGVPLPFPAVLTLLAVVPAAAGAATALALRPRPAPAEHRHRDTGHDPAVPWCAGRDPYAQGTALRELPWGIALLTAGLALGSYAGPAGPPGGGPPLPGRPDGIPPGAVAGWALVAVGLVTALPGLTQLAGRLLAAGRPGALRLLAGRFLQAEAERIGRPLGVLCAVATGVLAADRLYGGPGPAAVASFGPLLALGAALVVACVALTVVITALESRAERADTTEALRHAGTPAALLRRAAVLRAVVMAAVVAPVSWAVATLATLPLLS
ncbi:MULTISPECIES: hypothetical protein [Streptomyces]|uniref:Uncharacterized protein n=2 Tax=Streptomyces TaxID=1883 RepID=A0A3R7IBR1_9ACTN|nr:MULTISPECIES: hypothetical protein [Streptomyces]KNE82786.1 hypothetical protein ADZ36_09115 [Streptomyces fradiae]OFA43197.1 hypothetical protein BEN35_23350 [Streptomyces fradiae]PQM24516.1 hypothetical protein Sfr7A_07175 [Streptomyces xinghaiensis]RKM98184.1 hypothetical protein SFRA_006705 [Streptomyces xinghaiensis]RNC75120.1 hypothetical protein DC095_004735 [Streptomyces xinghaiensis]